MSSNIKSTLLTAYLLPILSLPNIIIAGQAIEFTLPLGYFGLHYIVFDAILFDGLFYCVVKASFVVSLLQQSISFDLLFFVLLFFMSNNVRKVENCVSREVKSALSCERYFEKSSINPYKLVISLLFLFIKLDWFYLL